MPIPGVFSILDFLLYMEIMLANDCQMLLVYIGEKSSCLDFTSFTMDDYGSSGKLMSQGIVPRKGLFASNPCS